MRKLTAKEKEILADGNSTNGLSYVDEEVLFMDSHGCHVVLVVCADEGENLLGFTYRRSSEEWFYEDDPMDLVPLTAKPITKTQYVRNDGKEWDV